MQQYRECASFVGLHSRFRFYFRVIWIRGLSVCVCAIQRCLCVCCIAVVGFFFLSLSRQENIFFFPFWKILLARPFSLSLLRRLACALLFIFIVLYVQTMHVFRFLAGDILCPYNISFFLCCLCFALLCECTILNVTLDLCLVLLLTQFRFAAPRRMQLVQCNTIRMDFPPESRWLPSYSYRIALNTNAFISCNNQFLLLLTNNMATRSLVHMQARGHSLKIHSNPILT